MTLTQQNLSEKILNVDIPSRLPHLVKHLSTKEQRIVTVETWKEELEQKVIDWEIYFSNLYNILESPPI